MKFDVPISQIMSQATIISHKNVKISEIKKLFHKYNMHHFPIVEDDMVVGIISSNDILRATLKAHLDEDPNFPTLAQDIMEPDVVSIHPDATIKDAAEFFSKSSFVFQNGAMFVQNCAIVFKTVPT